MAADRWTFLVVADENAPVKQYSVSARALRIAAGVAGAGVIGVLGVVAFLVFGGASSVKMQRLQARNEALVAELEQFRGRVDGLEASISGLATRDAQLRNLAGLESLDPEVLQAGVGGPGLGEPEAYPLYGLDPEVSGDAFALAYDLSALERRAHLLVESLDEATDSLQAHRDLLESTPSILPTTGWLSSAFSQSRMHPVHNRPLPHEGVDIAANEGTPIYAAAKGRIVRAGWVVGYGLTIEIDHGFGYTTLYGHASKLLARRGAEVRRGDVIAQVGSTGITTSSNLHYEVRVNGIPQNPANFILPLTVP